MGMHKELEDLTYLLVLHLENKEKLLTKIQRNQHRTKTLNHAEFQSLALYIEAEYEF